MDGRPQIGKHTQFLKRKNKIKRPGHITVKLGTIKTERISEKAARKDTGTK